jgi:hypothetical protein
MTNAEYEKAQLRALGAAMDAPIKGSTTNIQLLRDNAIRTQPNPGQPGRIQTQTPRTLGSPATIAPGKASPSRTGPVQKAGAIYIGPGGTSSRRVGAIMINSDGTTGQMIGNTIYTR